MITVKKYNQPRIGVKDRLKVYHFEQIYASHFYIQLCLYTSIIIPMFLLLITLFQIVILQAICLNECAMYLYSKLKAVVSRA
jgi:hypothetical protein